MENEQVEKILTTTGKESLFKSIEEYIDAKIELSKIIGLTTPESKEIEQRFNNAQEDLHAKILALKIAVSLRLISSVPMETSLYKKPGKKKKNNPEVAIYASSGCENHIMTELTQARCGLPIYHKQFKL